MKKILIVEDEKEIAELFKTRLEKNGYEAMIALNGQLALAICKSIHPDLVLLDIAMPKMNGYQIGEKLRQDTKTKDIDILFITCHDLESKSVLQRCEKIGTRGYFNKLSNFQELLEKIRGIIV